MKESDEGISPAAFWYDTAGWLLGLKLLKFCNIGGFDESVSVERANRGVSSLNSSSIEGRFSLVRSSIVERLFAC
jgi:hypothetical protein